MAINFGEHFGAVMDQMARETIEREYVWANTEPFEAPSQETLDKAKAFAERLVAEGKAMEFLRATAPKPCPECGRVD